MMIPIRRPVRSLVQCLVAATALAPLAAPVARAQTVVHFDVPEAGRPAMRAAMRDGGVFGGIRWDASAFWQVGSWGQLGRDGVLQCRSAPFCASPNGQTPEGERYGAFGFDAPVRFHGLWISGPRFADAGPPDWDSGDLPSQVGMQFFLGGALVHTTSLLDITRAPQWLGSGYAGRVDRVRLVGTPTATVVDDITYTATVPEPATVALLGGGLLGLAGLATRRRRG